MSVYTELTHTDISAILTDYNIGSLVSFEGIAAGIENSNFFITTRHADSTTETRYVLTVFERLAADELPYFMLLMKHLATQKLACPDVMIRHDQSLLFDVQGKQGCIVSCLKGQTLNELNVAQLKSSGQAMAQLHLAGAAFTMHRTNPTGSGWLAKQIDSVREKTRECYGLEAAELLSDELDYQSSCIWDALPTGTIHGDLFVDNILFEGDHVSGIIDFYYAHHAAFAMDIAISLNAQAMLLGDTDDARIQSFLDGYQSLRPLQEDEREALPLLLRLAALRFWVSRLYDAFFPRDGAMVQTKDPEEYRQKLLAHRKPFAQP